MPRNLSTITTKFLASGVGVNAIRRALSPISNYSRCESSAFVRRALTHAIHKDVIGVEISPYAEFIPTKTTLLLGEGRGRSQDYLEAIETEEQINKAAIETSAQLKKSRYFFEQANVVTEEIKPILYYYGSMYFLDFICLNIVRRRLIGSRGHGLSITNDSEGWDFDKNWARNKCRVQIGSAGDFPFYVDALTVSGWTTLFSQFRLHHEAMDDPYILLDNPKPLFTEKVSLDKLCNFNKDKYLDDYPDVKEWLIGTNEGMVWKLTELLMDVIVVYIASSLARYYTPAWIGIIEANKSDIYNDVRAAYQNVSEGFPLFFADEHPFDYSYGTRIPPY
ncbi:hypothetical protein [Pseudanabaena sp. ABRG5-3]|uniref:hypothetical protein n=1 Tax=Pseudanabaena sp. ABRG5-3 TaxID=685565 RepID=UPI000DC6DAEF|nr:hypothetical protein [Pseudanabaena sp. ABRG5-3]BBC24121.1 hypothetical protein ABRG53_1864 [Pseudanabaena sp. ABRG5-3]